MVRGLGESAMVDVDLGGSPTGSSVGAYCWGYLLLEIRCWLVYLKNYMLAQLSLQSTVDNSSDKMNLSR